MVTSTSPYRNGMMVLAVALAGAVVFGVSGIAEAQLADGHTRVIHGALHSNRHLFVDVPHDATRLVIRTWGGAGNADIYAKRGGTFGWPHRSWRPGNNERIEIPHPAPGRWWVRVHGRGPYHHVRIRADYDTPSAMGQIARDVGPALGRALAEHLRDRSDGDDNDDEDEDDEDDEDEEDDEDDEDDEEDAETLRVITLQPGVRQTGLRSRSDGVIVYRLVVPEGMERLTFATDGGSGGVALLVRREGLPTLREADYVSADEVTRQTVTVPDPEGGTYFARLIGVPRFRDVTLVADYRPAAPEEGTALPIRGAGAGQGREGLTLLSPSDGSTLAVGRIHAVTWQGARAGRNVRIELSRDGRTWEMLATVPAGSSMFLWYVPAELAEGEARARLRVRHSGGAASTARLTFQGPGAEPDSVAEAGNDPSF